MRSTLLVLLAMTLLTGCGKKGPLYLPDGPASGSPTSEQTAPRR
jgi:predicted small lipoprotein YifL